MKKIFITLFIASVIVMLIKVQSSPKHTDIVLANIEALASGEGSGTTLTCYKTISTAGSSQMTHVTYCGDCKAAKANAWSNKWQCTE